MSKLFYKPHKTPSNTTKRLEPAVLKQKQTTRKQQQLHHKDVSRYYFTGTPQQVITTSHITLKTGDETTFTLPTERTNFTLDLYPKK